MDEYLFITLAKLKADRLTLARSERREATPPEQLPFEWSEPAEEQRGSAPRPRPRSSLGSKLVHWFSQQPRWREQS